MTTTAVVHGIGLEHETAPAYWTDETGWQLLDVYSFNDENNKSPWYHLHGSLLLVVNIPGHLPKGKPKKIPKDATHPLGNVTLSFVDNQTLQENNRQEWRIQTSDYKEQFSKATVRLTGSITNGAKSKGWKRIQMSLRLSAWNTMVTVAESPTGILLSDIEKNLRKATENVFISVPPKSDEFEIDSGFIEVKSDRFKNATVSSIAKEVRSKENEVIERAREMAPEGSHVALLPRAQIVSNGAEHVETYAGSFHVWITLPHTPGAKFDHSKFIRDHSNLINTMQHLEPLLLACMPCDPRSPGSGELYSRASMRSRLNNLSGFVVANMPVIPSEHNVQCYESLESLNAGGDPKVIRTRSVIATTTTGEKVNLLACYWQERYAEQPRRDWNTGSGHEYQMEGTDFRYETCWSCSEQDVAFYKDGKTIRAAGDRGDGKFVPKVFCKPKISGVEFRVFDHMRIKHEHLLSIVVLAGAASQGREIQNGRSSIALAEQMLMCAKYGSRVPLSKAYWNCLRSAFGLDDNNKPVPAHAYAAVNLVLSEAFNKYKNSVICKRFGVKEAPVLPDVNFTSWTTAVSAMIEHDAALATKIDKVKKDPKSIVKHMGKGWISDKYFITNNE